jgi:hypothetical protein
LEALAAPQRGDELGDSPDVRRPEAPQVCGHVQYRGLHRWKWKTWIARAAAGDGGDFLKVGRRINPSVYRSKPLPIHQTGATIVCNGDAQKTCAKACRVITDPCRLLQHTLHLLLEVIVNLSIRAQERAQGLAMRGLPNVRILELLEVGPIVLRLAGGMEAGKQISKAPFHLMTSMLPSEFMSTGTAARRPLTTSSTMASCD